MAFTPMVQAPTKPLTLDQFLQLPETKPASEFINGHIIQKPMPQGKHSTIQSDWVPAANAVLKPDRIARAYSELRCTFGGRSVVPDISVFVWERIPRDENGKVLNGFALAPDWTVEILSPDQSQTRVVRNILHCLEHGTQMGYFSDRTVAIFEDKSDRLPVPEFADAFHLTVGQLFGWLAE
jgi:Uma2 family endonuclease